MVVVNPLGMSFHKGSIVSYIFALATLGILPFSSMDTRDMPLYIAGKMCRELALITFKFFPLGLAVNPFNVTGKTRFVISGKAANGTTKCFCFEVNSVQVMVQMCLGMRRERAVCALVMIFSLLMDTSHMIVDCFFVVGFEVANIALIFLVRLTVPFLNVL